MDYSIKMWTSQYHREKPMCFSVVRCWRGKKYERVVDVFKDLDKAKSCCEADMSSYDSSIVKKWKMSWEITEMPIKIKLDMDPIDRTRRNTRRFARRDLTRNSFRCMTFRDRWKDKLYHESDSQMASDVVRWNDELSSCNILLVNGDDCLL